MIKKLALALMIVANTQAEITIERFDLDEAMSLLYLQTNITEHHPDTILALNYYYKEWSHSIIDQVKTYDDIKYVTRLSHMYTEVMMSYYYRIQEPLPTQP